MDRRSPITTNFEGDIVAGEVWSEGGTPSTTNFEGDIVAGEVWSPYLVASVPCSLFTTNSVESTESFILLLTMVFGSIIFNDISSTLLSYEEFEALSPI